MLMSADGKEECRQAGCLECEGDLVSRLTTSVSHILTLHIPIINQPTKSP